MSKNESASDNGTHNHTDPSANTNGTNTNGTNANGDNTNGANANGSSAPHYLMWFRRDLRLHDNTALSALCQRANEDGASVSAVFFLTPAQWQQHDMSPVQVDHIIRTLPILTKDLQTQLNIPLYLYLCEQFSDCIDTIHELCETQNISLVMANHEYEGREMARDKQITEQLGKKDITFIRWHDQCVLPPLSITTNDNTMYKVFTPFYKKWRETLETGALERHQAQPIDKQSKHKTIELESAKSVYANGDNGKKTAVLTKEVLESYLTAITDKQTFQSIKPIDSDAQLSRARNAYPAGESAACHRLDQFIADDIANYDVSRDVPSLNATSQLSAYLTIGAISARHCYLQAAKAQDQLHGNDSDNEDINRWISELAWRDFYRHVLVDKPELIRHQAYKSDIDKKINWSYDKEDFAAWCQGMTGVPLVDAAMRCLNATGFMHNRLRMVTAMFLTKDLLIDWRLGERYFLQQLIDGDFASNNGGWQWSASTGTDAAPYFRIMNPFSQAKTHDPKAIFIKTWLPELKAIPATILHSEEKMRKALKTGGDFAKIDYPLPIVEHKAARQLAIAEFKKES